MIVEKGRSDLCWKVLRFRFRFTAAERRQLKFRLTSIGTQCMRLGRVLVSDWIEISMQNHPDTFEATNEAEFHK
jgi:hypothetical protein